MVRREGLIESRTTRIGLLFGNLKLEYGEREGINEKVKINEKKIKENGLNNNRGHVFKRLLE